MIFQSIKMFNFRQFVGEQQIDFSTDEKKNVTVLIGVNTSGKTTIIRAFEWCLYGKNGFDDPILLNSEVRSKMSLGESQKVYVSVVFLHDNVQYTLTRTYTYQCIDRRRENDEYIVSLSKKPDEDLILEYLMQDGQTKTKVERNNIQESIDRVLPVDLSDYFFFGGERISGIANRTDLSKAVRGLMRIDVLEHARDHLQAVVKKFDSMIDTTGNVTAQTARDSLETFKKQKDALEKELVNNQNEIDYWTKKEEEYKEELSKCNVEEVKDAQNKRDRIVSVLNRERNNLSQYKKSVVSAFNSRPYAFFGMPELTAALELLESVKDETEGIPAMEQGSIDYLLRRGFCICGTKLDKGTKPYDLVMSERRKLPPEQIGNLVSTFKSKAEGYLAGSETYFESIKKSFTEYRDCLRNIGQLEDELTNISNVIIDESAVKSIEEKRIHAANMLKDSRRDFDQTNKEIGKCDANIDNCEDTIAKFAKNSTKNAKIASYIAYSEYVLNWLSETYERKESEVREELEKRVNINFSKMYHGERSIIIDEKYRVKYSDITTEESDGLKAVKSFAFIASLVSMAKDKILDDEKIKFGRDYPLVMDAPFSNVDEIHIDNICRILPQTANQVIMAVMQKDWDYASKNLDKYVGISYSILKDRDINGKEIDTSSHIRRCHSDV